MHFCTSLLSLIVFITHYSVKFFFKSNIFVPKKSIISSPERSFFPLKAFGTSSNPNSFAISLVTVPDSLR